jgi:DNA polymerase III epsilon subunit-like protein
MATTKNKPRGAFDFLLAMDCETTGLCVNQDSPVENPKTGERHQTVSWGLIVADASTLLPIEKKYLEIKWNDTSKKQRESNAKFGVGAEKVHGLTFDYLEKNGITEEQAVVEIGGMILKYWSPEVSIRTLGHNVHTFDLLFLRDLFRRHEIELKFGSRHYDTNSIAFATFGTFNSDDFFDAVGFEKRGDHNALVDAEQALEATRRIRIIFQKAIEG